MKKISEKSILTHAREHSLFAVGPEVVAIRADSDFHRRAAVRELSRAMRSSLNLSLRERAELYQSKGFLWVAEKAGCNLDEIRDLADTAFTMDLDRIKAEVMGGQA